MKGVLYPEYKELLIHSSKLEYGTTILHEELLQIMKLKEVNTYYYNQIQKANRELLPKGKFLKNVSKIGYKVINPDEFIDVALEEIKRGNKRTQKAVQLLQYAPKELMSREYQTKYETIITKVQQLNSIISGGLVETKLFVRPTLTIR